MRITSEDHRLIQLKTSRTNNEIQIVCEDKSRGRVAPITIQCRAISAWFYCPLCGQEIGVKLEDA